MMACHNTIVQKSPGIEVTTMRDEQILRLEEMDSRHWWTICRQELVQKILSQKVGNSETLFEIGAGTGATLHALQSLGYKVVALEPTQYGADSCRKYGIKVHQNTLESLDIWPIDIGVILMLDVLEHISNDASALKLIAKHASDKTKLLITVPADPSLWSKLDDDVFHYRRYTISDLESVLHSAGWKIDYWRYWLSLLKPVVRFRRKVLKGDFSSETKMPRKWQNSILRYVVNLEKYLPFNKFFKGTTILVVASKNS